MKRSKILGVGSYLPSQIWKNSDLEKMMDTSDEWIQQRTGIRQRHWVDQNSSVCTSDLAIEASKKALENSKIKKDELDMVILATLSPDHEFPGTACFFQAKLNVPGIPALDVRQQCTGFIYGLSIADQFIRTGTYQKILVVGAEVHSKGLNKTPEGRDVGVLFGDGAGAVVLGSCEKSELSSMSHILSTHLHADGQFARELWVQEPSMNHPGDRMDSEYIKTANFYPQMNGKNVFIHAVRRMPEVILEALSKNELNTNQIDLYIFHQANLRINERVAKQLEIPQEKVFNTIDRFGNTTAATIPIGFDEAIKAGKLKPGMLVVSAAFGSGFTWAATVIRW